MLQRVAVVGEQFTARDAILLSGRKSADVLSALQRLSELLYLRPLPGGQRFHHALVHDVAYARLTTAERMRLHAQYARHGVPPDDAQALAYHLWDAVGPQDAEWVWEGSEELSDLRLRALDAQLASARRYADRFAYEHALEVSRRAFRFATKTADVGRVEQTIGSILAAKGEANEAWEHYLRSRESYLDAGIEPPPDLYPSLLEFRVYTSGMFVHLPDEALVEAFLDEGEDVARRAGDMTSLARLRALRAYRSHDAMELLEALQMSSQVADSAALGSFLQHAAILENRIGEFAVAKRIYERLDALSIPGVMADHRLEFRAILALNTGAVTEAEDLARQFLAVSASRGPHLQSHALREQSHVLLAQGNWRGLCDLAMETETLVSEHPETAFCYAVTTILSFAVVAHALEGRKHEARSLLVRAERPMQAEPLERESVLLLANGVVGNAHKIAELRASARQSEPQPFWFFSRMEAVSLTMLERWDELNEVLRPLAPIAAKDSPYLEAFLSAVREEMTAAQGGPAPRHSMLRKLGFKGWSQLLAHRPSAS